MAARRIARALRSLSGPALPVLAALALLTPNPVHAQAKVDLKGRVVEMGTARPLAGAEVMLPSIGREVVSNAEGTFVVKGLLAGRYRVEVEQLGYRTHQGELEVGGDSLVTVELWPDPVVLEGLSAQVNRLERRRNAIPSTVRIADRGELATATNMENTIRSLGETLVYCGSGNFCLMRRGRPVVPTVFIDERPAFGMDELSSYLPSEFHTVEVIGHTMIRAYTVGFMERLALGKASLFPVLFY